VANYRKAEASAILHKTIKPDEEKRVEEGVVMSIHGKKGSWLV